MSDIPSRLEYLRQELRAERISMGELHELQSLAKHIDPSDVELLEAAGVPEFYEARFAIDLPNPNDPEDMWQTYDSYATREEALAAAQHHFGADSEGRINLISKLPEEE